MRLILIRLSALGDIVHTWPLAQALRDFDPKLHLSWIVERPFRSLVEGHPAVDSVFETSTGRWRKSPFSGKTRHEIGMLRTSLHELSPDIALDSQGTMKSAWVSRWTKASERVGLARPWRREWPPGFFYDRCLPGSERDHVVETNLALLRVLDPKLPLPRLKPDGAWFLEKALKAYPDFSIPESEYGLIFPGAGREEKILPIPLLAEIAQGMFSRALKPIIAWGPGERERAIEIAASSPAEIAPPTNLEELALLMSKARVILGADTGPIHLAASLGQPVLGIFLTTDPRRNGPLGPRVRVCDTTRPGTKVPRSSSRAPAGKPPDSQQILRLLDDLLHEKDAGGTMAEEMEQQKGHEADAVENW